MTTLLPVVCTAYVTNASDEVEITGLDASTGVAAVLTDLNCRPNATVYLGGVGYLVAERTDTTHFRLERDYEGATSVDPDPGVSCTIGVFSPEMANRAELATHLREYIQLAGLIENTGIGIDAFGTLDGRDAFDDVYLAADGLPFVYLALTYAGEEITDAGIYLKHSPADGDWTGPVPFRGALGPKGDGLHFDVQVAELAGRDEFDGAGPRFAILVSDTGDGRAAVYVMGDGGSGDWGAPAYVTPEGAGSAENVSFTPAGDLEAANVQAALEELDAKKAASSRGLPSGGAAGQVLAKASGDDHDTEWVEQSGGREVLTANRTYYVRTDGDDNNDGLTNTSGGAFLTLSKAMDTIGGLDLSTYSVTVQLGAGTHTGGATINKPWVGGSEVIIHGDTGTPANVVVERTGNHGILVQSILPCPLRVRGFDLRVSTFGDGIRANAPSIIYWEIMIFGAIQGSALHASQPGTYLEAKGNYEINGSMQRFFNANSGGFIRSDGRTVTLTGTPAFSSDFAAASFGAGMNIGNITFLGGATGRRYTVNSNAVISTAGGGASYLPGDTNGTTANGGLYL